MKTLFEQAFSNRIALFFRKRNITTQQFNHQFQADYDAYCHFLLEAYRTEYPVCYEKNVIRLRDAFMLKQTMAYCKNDAKAISSFFRTRNPGRYTPRFFEQLDQTDSSAKNPRKKDRLIHIVGRHDQPRLKVTDDKGHPLSPRTRANAQKMMGNLPINFSPVKNRPLASSSSSEDERPDASIMVGGGVMLSRRISPLKPPQLLVADDIQPPMPPVFENQGTCRKPRALFPQAALLPIRQEKFQFSVTKQVILDRMNIKRSISQKTLMGNKSAFEVLSTINQELCTLSSRHYHWAHIHGLALGGAQAKENLIPSTAGSNYDTLFKVEAPIRDLLFRWDNVSRVDVTCVVQFAEHDVPHQIIYELSFGGHALVTVNIDPMDPRVPTVSEYDAARKFLHFVNDRDQMNATAVNTGDVSTLEEEALGHLSP